MFKKEVSFATVVEEEKNGFRTKVLRNGVVVWESKRLTYDEKVAEARGSKILSQLLKLESHNVLETASEGV